MKRILVTGANSYIGISFEEWLIQQPDKYIVDTLDMQNVLWKNKDFSGYATVLHVAGIAHVRETKKNKELYFKVNRDLAFETAKKAKLEGVKHFVFLSTMNVYGLDKGIITKDTKPTPKTAYGKSKYQAEQLIKELENETFIVSIIRPPMVYGSGCKGNYKKLAAFAKKTSIFPNIDNKRSMIYIDNLSEFIRLLIEDQSSGLFFPQNNEYIRTAEMVNLIAEQHGKKIVLVKLFNPFIKFCMIISSTCRKIFGSLIYDKSFIDNKSSNCKYQIYSFRESIERTEKRIEKIKER